MLYTFLKIPAKFALHFYCRKIFINKPEALLMKGPLIIAANHPNSFLDAIILATIFHHPIYSLARGDAFANNFFTKLLRSLNMLPVYRKSEGAENLEINYTTFNECIEIFKNNGIVLIFSEGRCINEWHLRPLKKGTARLAISAWQQNIPLKVIPLGINYSSFRNFGKNVILNFGEVISANGFDIDINGGKPAIDFNFKLNEQLKKLVIEINSTDKEKIQRKFYVHQHWGKRILMIVPAIAGWVVHLPLYYPITLLLKNKAEDHYDSIVVGLLFLLYPFYIFLLSLSLYLITKNGLSWLCIILLPFTAWCYLQVKRQFY
ncbi:MAG: 1-acyl-sn-glycerol-3-phosphate acyltransferase [Ginsengibacter sp.]